MTSPLIAAGFGLVVLSMAFLVVVFGRAYRDPAKHFDASYRIIAGALTVGSLGVGLWALNPLSQALGGPPLNPWLMLLATALILGAASSMIGSTAIGGNKATLALFLLLSALWTTGSLVLGYMPLRG